MGPSPVPDEQPIIRRERFPPYSSSHTVGPFQRILGLFPALLLITGCAIDRLIVPLLVERPGTGVLWSEPFDQLDANRWQEVEVDGQTDYAVVDLEGRRCLRADSRGGASILLSKLRFRPDRHEWLSWHWRVDRLIEGEALERKDGSDASARVYVYFDTGILLWQRKSIDYVWSATLPIGTILSSAYSSNSKIIVAESGSGHVGQWQAVVRNLEDDYRRCFGAKPPDAIAIGVMTDTDNTGATALAYFDDLRISRSKPPVAPTSSEEG